MSVYLVTWNLNKERSNYEEARKAFVAHLEGYEHTKDVGLETVRWISTTNSAAQIDEFLRQKLDKNDRLFVSMLRNGEHQGWLARDVWDWINGRV